MNLSHVRTVYFKELADVLRDRRTLIATIVVPVVLYPLLMLLSLQAVSMQTAQVREEKITVGFANDADCEAFRQLLEEEKAIEREPAAEGDSPAPEPLADHATLVTDADLRDAVLQRRIQVGVRFEPGSDEGDELTRQLKVELLVQPEQIRSASAANRVESMLRRLSEERVRQRLARLDVDLRTIEPIVLNQQRISTSGSMLALIVPMVLVLMTITSAIYPAIDLTAGERERGTLETLLACPVPVLDLVVGKFLTVATIGILGATLNLASIAATVYFGGLGELLGAASDASGGEGGGGLPFYVVPVILLCLIPFAVLMSAILTAVCGFARSFKEAQNYITPVIISVLLPAMVASLPGTKLEGLMLVLPVGNMVLLTRELLSGAAVPVSAYAWVLLSTCAYAAVAVSVAAQSFGKESVMFADAVSLRAMISRRHARPRQRPTFTMAALYAAVLFPVWFYLQTLLQQQAENDLAAVLRHTAVFMPLLFVVLPVAILAHYRVDWRETLALRPPGLRFVAAAVLLGFSMWVAAHELFVLQQRVLPVPPQLTESNEAMVEALSSMPVWLMLVCIAVVPAVSEELFFRGYVMSGLRTSMRKWPAMIAVSLAFGMFHFFLFKLGTTFALGLVLAWLCWQSRSIWPGVLAHAIHNGFAAISGRYPSVSRSLGVADAVDAHLPATVLLAGFAMLATGLALTIDWRRGGSTSTPSE